MKKLLTVLLVIAVMFTFSFGSAFAGTFEAKTSEDKAALITVAQTELAASKDYLDTVKAYYLKNFTDISLTGDYAGVTVKKAAVEKIIDDVFKAITKKVTAAYNDVIIAINQGSVTIDGVDEPTLADAKDAVKKAVKDAYTAYNADAIEDVILDDFVAEAAEAQFDIVKADALATLDKVNFGNYSTTVPDDPTYDTTKYYSNQKIAQTIVGDAKDSINDIKFKKDAASANVTAITTGIKAIVDAAVVEDTDKEGVYYVIADSKVAAAATETAFEKTLVKRSATEAKDEKTLAEEKAYQISVVNGKISLAEAKIRKELGAKLEEKLADKEKKLYEDVLADLTKYIDACKEVAAARINYAETKDAAISEGAGWEHECDLILEAAADAFTKAEVEKYVGFFKSYVAITEKVDELEAEAAKLKAQTGFNGAPLYDAEDIDDALEAAIKDAYFGRTATLNVVANEDLVKAEMNRVLGLGSDNTNVVLDKVTYPTVANWYDDDAYEHSAKKAEADKIIRETVDAIRAAKTVADVDAAFVAGYEKFEAVPTAEDYDKFWGKDETEEAVAKYAAKLVASLVEKIADYGQDKFEKDYDLDTEKFVDNLLETYMADAYTMDELASGYAKALDEIKNLKTKAELEAEQKAINDAIIAIKAPVTAADETAVLAVADRVADFYDYQKLLGLYEGQTYEYPVYDSLLNQYVEELKALAEEKLEDAYDAIQKGGITVEDEAAIAELEKMVKAYYENYGDDADLVDAWVAGDMADLKAALTNAKADAVEAAIAKIDASAKPLDLAAIKAAREAYDALGEVGIDNTMYHKLLSLENLAKAESIASVEALKITAKSTAKKGSITVTWSVVGDDSSADGYQIWKSTKKNSGYKKAFTTAKKTYKNTKGLKKGTRYYYKVRAYVVVEGKTYYSDWSNKAFRKAK